MARPRKKENAHLPPHVHEKSGMLYHVRDGVWTRLGPAGMEQCDLYLAMARHAGARVGEPAKPAAKGTPTTMVELLDRALPILCKGTKYPLSPSTVRSYTSHANALKKAFEVSGTTVAGLTDTEVENMRDELRDRPSAFNAMLTVLDLSMRWAKRQKWIAVNPCADVERLTAPRRMRQVVDSEYQAIYQRANPREQVVMDLCYLTAQRIKDVLRLKETDLTDAGIMFWPSKTKRLGKRICVEWTPDLREVVDRARALRGGAVRFENAAQYAAEVGRAPMAEGYLLAARGGKRALPYHTVYRAWRIAVETAGIDDVRIHDMRAMSMTELALAHGDLGLAKANAAGGHSTMNQTRDYVRHTLPTRVQGPARRIAPIKAK